MFLFVKIVPKPPYQTPYPHPWYSQHQTAADRHSHIEPTQAHNNAKSAQNRRFLHRGHIIIGRNRSNSAKIRPFSPFSLLLTYKVSSEVIIIDCRALFCAATPKSYLNQQKSRTIQAHPGPNHAYTRIYIHTRTHDKLQMALTRLTQASPSSIP